MITQPRFRQCIDTICKGFPWNWKTIVAWFTLAWGPLLRTWPRCQGCQTWATSSAPPWRRSCPASSLRFLPSMAMMAMVTMEMMVCDLIWKMKMIYNDKVLPSRRPPSSSSSCRPRRWTLGQCRRGQVWSVQGVIIDRKYSHHHRHHHHHHDLHGPSPPTLPPSHHYQCAHYTFKVSGGTNPPPIGPSFLQFSRANLFIPACGRKSSQQLYHTYFWSRWFSFIWSWQSSSYQCWNKPSFSCRVVWHGRRQFPPWKVPPSWGLGVLVLNGDEQKI